MRPLLTALVASAWVALAGCGSSAIKPARPQPAEPLPAEAYAHYLRGRLAMQEADFAAAVVHFRTASSAAPQEAQMRVALADALVRAGRKDQALDVAERAQKRFNRQVDVWLVSGRIYRALGRAKDAVRAYERAVALAPREEPAYKRLGATWITLRRPDLAEKTYRKLVRARPASVAGNYLLAARLLARGAHVEAIRAARNALRGEPDHVRALVVLARSLHATGKPKQSVAVLRRAFDRSEGDARVGEQLFYQLLGLGARDDAIRLLGVIDRDDLPVETRVSFGYLYLQIHARTQALAVAHKLVTKHPDSDDARLLETQTLAEMGRDLEALKRLLAVPSTARTYAASRAMAGELLAHRGELARARAVIDGARASHGRNADLIIADATVHRLAGAPSRARLVFARALRNRPRDITLLYAYAELEGDLGNPAHAVQLANRVLALDAQHAEAMNLIGYSLAHRKIHLRRAERLLRRAMALSPGNGYIMDSFGWLLFRQGHLSEAEKVLRRADHLTPAEPEILWHLAELRIARRDRAAALRLLLRAQRLRPRGRVKRMIETRIQALRGDKW